MEVKHEDNGYRGSFYFELDGNVEGEMTYVWSGPNKIIIDHTDVNPEFKGKNIGKQLVMKAVEYARENKLKIMPLCPFAKSVFDRNEDIRDVLF